MAYIIAYFTAFIVFGISISSVGPTLPGLAAQLSITLGGISFLVASRSIGRVVGTFAGRGVDRFPGNPIIAGSLLAISLAMMLTAVLPVFYLLIPVWFLMGVSEGLMDVSVNTMMIWVHKEKIGALLLAMHACFGIGAFLAPVIIAQVTGDGILPVMSPFNVFQFPTQLAAVSPAYLVLAMLYIPVILLVLRLPSPKPHQVEADETTPVQSINMRLVLLLTLFFTIYVAAEASMSNWIFAYALGRNLTTQTTGIYLVSVFWGMITVGRLLAVPIAARFHPRTILLTALVGTFASLLLMTIFPNLLWVGVFGMGLFMAAVFPTTMAFAEQRLMITGKITSTFYIGAGFGAIIFPWLVGVSFDLIGVEMLLVIEAILLTGLFVVYRMLTRHDATLSPQA
ncbi:MAG: MFS transporter [Phototrophicales bacterium]